MSDYGAIGPLEEDETPRSLEVNGTPRLNERHGRKERRYLTYALLLLTVVLTVVVLLAAIWAPDEAWARLTAQLGFLITPFHTLLGIAVGYYFADKRHP